MSKELRFGGTYAGYDVLVRGEAFVALKGKDVPELTLGQTVVLEGDGKGVVSATFKAGETVTIIGFREPFEHGNSDDIIEVSNGSTTGWVKPKNIQKTHPAPPPTGH